MSAARNAIQRPDELADTAERGRRQVLARYSWDSLLADRLDGVWNDVAIPGGTGVSPAQAVGVGQASGLS